MDEKNVKLKMTPLQTNTHHENYYMYRVVSAILRYILVKNNL